MTWKRCAKMVVVVAMLLGLWPRGASADQLSVGDPPQAARNAGRHPLTAQTAQHRSVQVGVASYYGAWHRGHITASGAPFDDRKLTAAHRTLPLGTHVQVTNLKNGRSVILKINDRGPYVRHRLIDVSAAAARVLGFTHRGITPVKVRVVDAGNGQAGSAPPGGGEAPLNAGAGS